MNTNSIAFALNPVVRFLCLQAPALRPALWHKLIGPKLCWRDFRFQAETETGLQVTGTTVDVLQRYLYYFGIWEPVVSSFIQRRLKPGDVFVDVGANVGYLSLLAAQKVGPGGQVISIEASSRTYAKLKSNVERNGMKQMRTVWGAVSDTLGEVRLFQGPATNSGLASLIRNNEAGEEEVVQAGPLDHWLRGEEAEQAKLIKIDVEGAELLVARGLKTLLGRLRPEAEILMEISPALLSDAEQSELMAMFAAAGFRAFQLQEDTIDLYLYPAKVKTEARRYEGLLRERADVVFSRAAGDVI